jgi:protease I
MLRLNGLRVAVVATDGFEAAELEEPNLTLVRHEATTVVASLRRGEIQGLEGGLEYRRRVPVDALLGELGAEDLDAVVLPGGTGNVERLRGQPEVHRLLQAMNAAGKSIVAIGHAPRLLVAAGLVAGRVVTGDASLADAVRNAGGQWVDQAVVEDRNWITSRGPEDLGELNRHLLLHLAARTYRHSA